MGNEQIKPIATFNGLEFYDSAAHALVNDRTLSGLELVAPKLYVGGKTFDDARIADDYIKGRDSKGLTERLGFPHEVMEKMYLEALEAISEMKRTAMPVRGVEELEDELNRNLSIVALVTELEDAIKCTNYTGVIGNGTIMGVDPDDLPQGMYKHVSLFMSLSYIILSAEHKEKPEAK